MHRVSTEKVSHLALAPEGEGTASRLGMLGQGASEIVRCHTEYAARPTPCKLFSSCESVIVAWHDGATVMSCDFVSEPFAVVIVR